MVRRDSFRDRTDRDVEVRERICKLLGGRQEKRKRREN